MLQGDLYLLFPSETRLHYYYNVYIGMSGGQKRRLHVLQFCNLRASDLIILHKLGCQKFKDGREVDIVVIGWLTTQDAGFQIWRYEHVCKYERALTSRTLMLGLRSVTWWKPIVGKEEKVSSQDVLNASNSEINPTRCNNCVYSSQWLYSTCFRWQFHPSSGVHMLYMASGRQVYLCCNFVSIMVVLSL